MKTILSLFALIVLCSACSSTPPKAKPYPPADWKVQFSPLPVNAANPQ
jgi:predicted component of type VI protein secretion system